MNFTREPIIETILSARDGYKLSIKNSKVPDSEEILVDAVEVVSFGQAFFFRGQERPKPFLVPVNDYEVFEVKDARVVLKNVAYERNIKIGGGRDSFSKPVKEVVEEEGEEKEVVAAAAPKEAKVDKKRERRRNRRKKLAEERKDVIEKVDEEEESSEEFMEEGVESIVEEKIPVSFAQLLPPPSTLISESIARMKAEAAKTEAAMEVTVPSEPEINSSDEISI